MTFKIQAYENINFDIPAGKDKSITITVPPLDCLEKRDVDALNRHLAELRVADAVKQEMLNRELKAIEASEPLDAKALEAKMHEIAKFEQGQTVSPNNNAVEMTRFMLKHFNQAKAKQEAIENLVPRYMTMISKQWEAQSETDLGKSDGSTEPSSTTSE